MDIQKEREEFETFYKTKILTADHEIAMLDQLTEFHIETGLYEYARMQTAWETWQAVKSQAVPEEFEIGRLQDRITELLDERQELYAQLNTGTTKGFTLVQKDLIQSIHQSCVNSLIAESMPAFKAVANTIIYELSPMVKAIQVEAQEQSHDE